MRNFIISDLHGNGFIYDSVLNYLQNELEYGNDDITLYINGDLIDRGLDSGSMLLDVYDRVTNNIGVKIKYLAGNHELFMYEAFKFSEGAKLDTLFEPLFNKKAGFWISDEAGFVTSRYLIKYSNTEEVYKIMNFIGNLDVYHIFDEKVNDKRILLVHACALKSMEDNVDLKLGDGSTKTEVALNTRKDSFLVRGKVGNDKFFTIIGHTPLDNEKYGYLYDPEDNTLNIDGASALFSFLNTRYLYKNKDPFTNIIDVVKPFSEYDKDVLNDLNHFSHSPLVEVENDRLKILTFNYKNEIIYGNYFQDGISIPIDNNDLEKYRKNLSQNTKIRKREKRIS